MSQIPHRSGELKLRPQPREVPVSDLGGEIHQIDTKQSGYEGITAAYLIRSDRPCLVETGTQTSAQTVIAHLAALGIDRNDLASIVVTHIHLDHAGGVGTLTDAFPNAQVYVHERGAKHVVDPSRLVASARRVFGPAMDLIGEMTGTDLKRVHALESSTRIDLGGGRFLEAFDAPGHASHHVGLIDSVTGDLFVGDAAGIYIPETGDVLPATAPPEFDFNLARETLTKFKARDPQRLLFSHYGPVDNVRDVLELSEVQLLQLIADVKTLRQHAHHIDHAVGFIIEKTNERLRELANRPDVRARFDSLNSTATNVLGVNRWLNSVEGTDYAFSEN